MKLAVLADPVHFFRIRILLYTQPYPVLDPYPKAKNIPQIWKKVRIAFVLKRKYRNHWEQ
jgi:hypothetical protein